MNKIATTLAMLMLASATALPAPAAAQSVFGGMGSWNNMSSFCERHPRNPDCWDWRKSNQNRFHRNHLGIGGLAAGFFGFALGAAVVSSFANNGGSSWAVHVARCEAEFISYSRRTDMYLGFDGDYHRCRL